MDGVSKIKGMFLGLAVGDALGMPVETFSQKDIAEKYPDGIRDYVSTDGHIWFDGCEPGTYTDDTQLSLSVAKGILRSNSFDMDAIAEEHVTAMTENTNGWGKTTVEAIQRLKEGEHWSKCASLSSPNKPRGVGNGVPMKIAPLAAFHFVNKTPWKKTVAEVMTFTKMTHPTSMSISAGLAHDVAIQYCLRNTPDSFNHKDFIDSIVNRSVLAEGFIPVRHGEDNITTRFKELYRYQEYKPNSVIEAFGGGSCYVYNSLPFTYMHFLKNPTFQCVYDAIESGGDTDTNGSMCGALVGALHGIEEIPKNLVDKVQDSEVLCNIATRLSNI